MGYANAVSYKGRCVLKRVITTAILLLSLFAVSAVADEFTGWISDSKCGAKGVNAEHKECAAKCVKGGAAPVFVMDNKVLKIGDASKVEGYIGQKVTVTGSVDGDTIKVESVKAAD
jgi:hypothetical protein